MKCYKCGWEMAAFEMACPRCAKQPESSGTQRLDTIQTHDTMYLVQLDQCAHCRWIIFPTDTVCSSCGAPVQRVAPRPATAKTEGAPATEARRENLKKVAFGIATGAAVVGVIALLVHFLRT